MKKLLLIVCVTFAVILPACKPNAQHEDATASAPPTPVSSPPPISDEEFNKAQTIIASSCMPCHNRQTLPNVIALTQKATFKAIGSDTRPRILGELGELKNYMDSGLSISFTSKEELEKFFNATAGEFYLMLDKGLMPPPWAPELMQQIKWPHYEKLTPAKRLELMKFSKPYTEKYLR